jgi:hypothetical protein
MIEHYESHAVTVSARLIMRSAGSPCLDGRGGVHYWSWGEDECEAVFRPADEWQWLNRLSALEQQSLAGLCAYADIPEDLPWEDEASEEYFERYVTAGGVVALARWYREGA